MSQLEIATETIELPSRGLVYDKSNPLSSGEVEMKYMTALEEDILTNQTLIKKGNVIDKMLESLTMKKVKIQDLVPGDKNALIVAARILGYGKKYNFTHRGVEKECNLDEIENKLFDESNLIEENKNLFEFILPNSEVTIQYKLLTGEDETKIQREIEGIKRVSKDASPEVSTRMKYMITSVEGNTDKKDIRSFVDNNLRAIDSKALRDHIKITQPDVDMFITLDDGEEIELPITVSFFWPD